MNSIRFERRGWRVDLHRLDRGEEHKTQGMFGHVPWNGRRGNGPQIGVQFGRKTLADGSVVSEHYAKYGSWLCLMVNPTTGEAIRQVLSETQAKHMVNEHKRMKL